MSNEVTTVQERIAQQLAKQQEAATGMRSTGAFISFKNGNMKVDGIPVPENKALVRVLVAIPERTYYEGDYDANETQVPNCYSLNSDEPHPEAADIQATHCSDCPNNKWGTGKRGRGKACREGARLIVVPAAVPLKTAPMYTAKVPVTSLANVLSFTSRCAQAQKMSGEFITELSSVEDAKTFFKVHLTLKELSADINMVDLLDKTDKAMEIAMQPYPNLDN